MPWYESGNNRLWYEEHGTGPALVLLHGWCMSSAVWRLQFEELSVRYRIIAPDLAGHGKSGACGGNHGFDRFAADIVALFRHLELREALLGGWSMGAQVVLDACGRLREQVAGLVLISATPRFTVAEDFPWGLSPVEAKGMAVKLRRNAPRALEGFTARMFAPGEPEVPDLAARIRELLDGIPVPATDVALQSLESLAEADMRPLLFGIDLPTLIINGDRDVICLPGASEYLARQMPLSSRVVMNDCGHAPFLTRSREFAACIDDFGRRVRERSR
ncbi:MAG TPA: alpha/beta fold hydrolase [Desulfuromonadaceae bacterium]